MTPYTSTRSFWLVKIIFLLALIVSFSSLSLNFSNLEPWHSHNMEKLTFGALPRKFDYSSQQDKYLSPGAGDHFVKKRSLHVPVVVDPDLTGDLEFQRFITEIYTGETSVVRGVYVSGLFAFPIIQQPPGNDTFVSVKSNLVTQFRQAEDNGVIGLLAHNYLSGEDFSKLEVGQDIYIVYGDKDVRHYQVISVYQFQKLNPSNLYSNFINLKTHEQISMNEVYNQFYRGSHHVIFQTCLEGEGRLDWGLLFVVAVPLPN